MDDSSRHPARPLSSLDIRLLGVVDFDAALFLQERTLYEISGRGDAEPRGTVLLCEHPPLVTLGREGSRRDLRLEPEEFVRQGIPIRWINRGGGAVAHGPGQLAIYPILPLGRMGLSVAAYRDVLENAIVRACHELRAPAQAGTERPGVWGRRGQLAEIGMAVKRSVSMHGAYVNVAPHPFLLELVRPASGDVPTSLSAQQAHRTPMSGFREAIMRHLAESLQARETHVFTGSPYLRRTTRPVPLFAKSDEPE